MASRPIIPFFLTTCGAVALIVACSPTNGKAPIKVGAFQASAFESAVSSCVDSVSLSQKLKFQNGARKVNVCEMPTDGKATKPVPSSLDVSFSLEKTADTSLPGPVPETTSDTSSSASELSLEEGSMAARSGAASVTAVTATTVQLSMQIGLLTKENLDDAAKKDFLQRFQFLCVNPTEAIVARSKFGPLIRLRLKLGVGFATDDVSGSISEIDATTPADVSSPLAIDQYLQMTKVVEGEDTSWAFVELPSAPRFYPRGLAADTKACVAAGGSKKDVLSCVWNHRQMVNLPLCAAFAKRVGNGLGIVDAASEKKTCGATPSSEPVASGAASSPKAPSGGTGISNQAFKNSTFAEPSENPDEFLNKSTLNQKDLMTILAPIPTPACSKLKDLK